MFFLHIPKTSGSSTNRLLERVYGRHNFVDHAENVLPRLMDRSRPTQAVDCVTAHVPLCRWSLFRGTDAYPRVTVLRDPWARLVSHVNWIARFNHGEPMPTGKTAPALARVVAVLGQTDFADRASLMRLFEAASAEEEFTAFDNMQVRMLITGHPRATFKRLEPGDAAGAMKNLLQFRAYGFCEDRVGFEAALLAVAGAEASRDKPIHANPGTRLAMTADNDLAREVFAPWIALDQELYDAARLAAGRDDGAA